MTDPMPRWEGYTHREMYDIVHTGPGREITDTVVDLWADVETLILRIEQQIEEAISGTAASWAGSAAEASRAAMTPLGLWALDAAGDARLVVEAIAGQAWQSVYLRSAMPEPQVPITVAGGGGFYPHGIPDEQANDVAEVNLTARAVDLMNNYTNMSYVSEGYLFSSTFPPPVVLEQAAAGVAGPGGWSGPRHPGVGIEPAVVGPPGARLVTRTTWWARCACARWPEPRRAGAAGARRADGRRAGSQRQRRPADRRRSCRPERVAQRTTTGRTRPGRCPAPRPGERGAGEPATTNRGAARLVARTTGRSAGNRPANAGRSPPGRTRPTAARRPGPRRGATWWRGTGAPTGVTPSANRVGAAPGARRRADQASHRRRPSSPRADPDRGIPA